MKTIRYIVMLISFIGFAYPIQAQFSGNPLLRGADPEIHYFNNKYYIYTTTVDTKKFHAYSSEDLTNWKDEGVIFDIGPQCVWTDRNGWAPGVVFKNNKYYFYYTADTKIGVAVGDSPIGPFTDPLGVPLIGTDPYTNDIIDAMVFTDDNNQSYIYYGGSSGARMVVRKLNADMISINGGATDITPPNYTEGPFLVKRNGIYYMTYSNGYWGNDTYNVRYSTSNSPVGPWTYRGVILQSNDEDKGPGHHAILKMGDCDEYYIIYHRYENGLGGSRQVCIDRMFFNADGLIDKVNMTNYGVEARRPDNSCTVTTSLVSGGTYKLKHKGTNQCLDVLNNSNQSGANVQQYTDNGNDAQRWIITLESDGFYKLTHKGTKLCLDVSNNSKQAGANVQQYTDNETDSQRWKIEAMSDGFYKLTHKGTSLCLDVANNSNQPNANVQQWTDNGNDAQRWELELIEAPIVSGGLYRLVHKGTNQCLDVANNSKQAGSNVEQATINGNLHSQLWYITLENDGYYQLKHKGTNLCLDVANNSNQSGANVLQWTDLDNAAQRWAITLMPDGYFKLTHKGTTMCLNVDNNLSEPGANILQYSDNGTDAQRWKLELIPDISPIIGSGNGVTGNYFNGMNFETPKFHRTDSTVNFDWGQGSPNANITTNQFSARWTGQVQPQYTGEYSFHISSDDGRRLWVNNQLIIDRWVSDVSNNTGKIYLTAGQKYEIKLEYFENGGGANCALEWSSTFQGREIIPINQLYKNTLPVINFVTPNNNQNFNIPASVAITTNTSDADGSVAKVEFYNGTTKLGEDLSSPFSYTWTNMAKGAYTITARIFDNRNAVAISSPLSISVSDQVTEIDASIEGEILKIAPNPSASTIYITSTIQLSNAVFNITDLQGKVQANGKLVHNEISVEDLPSGMYLLEISNGETRYIHRLVKK
jgi:hypothetical protein